MLTHRHHARRAFTLIELLVVLAIISILAGLLLPALGAARANALSVKCRGNMVEIGRSLAIYADNNNGVVVPYQVDYAPPMAHPQEWPLILYPFPPGTLVAQPYPKIVRCPTVEGSERENTYLLNSSFSFARIRLWQVTTVPPSEAVLMGEACFGRHALSDYLSSTPPLEQNWTAFRHGPRLKSNYLWADLHVDNTPAIPHDPAGHPDDIWYIQK